MSDNPEQAPGWQGQPGERGEKGDKGDRGEEGKPSTRLPVKQARAVVYLFFFSVLVSLTCLAGLVYYGHELSAQQQAVSREQQAVARTQREFLAAQQAGGKNTCGTIEQITAIPVKARTWGARFEVIERHRLRELECTR